MIARVVIIPTAGDAGPLDYAIGAQLEGAVRPGMRVVVPLGTRRAIGLVSELAAASPHPHLKPIVASIDTQPVLDDALLRLCRWVAEYYLCSFGAALSTALPGSLRAHIERVAWVSAAGTATTAAPPETNVPANGQRPRPLATSARQLLDWLATAGPQATGVVAEKFGRRALASLQRHGLIHIDEHVSADTPVKRRRHYRAARALGDEEAREWRRRRPAQYAVYAYLHDHPLHWAAAPELQATFPNAAAKLSALIAAGLVASVEEEVYRTVLSEVAPEDRPVRLTDAQHAAVGAVEQSLGAGFHPFLLWGVTGSGKTEVYLRCIAACLAAERSALVLVPEISLTHQLVDRVRGRFGNRVAVLHSALSDGERWDEWRKISRGEVAIVVGARSAVFAPLRRLGLVVVDEEHDTAYKQEDGIRYNGRDVAVMRAKLAGCSVVMGSATPAMETLHNARVGRYRMLALPERVEARPLPSVDIVDLRRSSSAGRAVLVSAPLAAALEANLAAHGQSLVFLNRRGFANFLQCHACGDALMCPNCSVTLTLHRRWHALRCHHCDHTTPLPSACPSCGTAHLGAWGAGTEQVEATLRRLLPGARVARLDRDTTSRKGALRDMLAAWQRRDYDVLVGTQMITKGHDVPGVTLVGVVLADSSLSFPDFRATERTFQLLTQVAGRAGRGARPGRVIVQTLQPQHFSLQSAAHHDYHAFADNELAARRELGYPPFARLVQLRCEGEQLEATERVARALALAVQQAAASGVAVLGPAPAPIERLRRRHRWQLLVRGRHGAAVRTAARRGCEAVRRQARAADVRIIIDVDPYSML